MKQSLSLSVPKPCHEKWKNFSPTNQGGFCSGCQKEVIDFTHWDDEKIKTWFSTRTGPTCGRFRPEQLKTYSPGPSQATNRTWLPLSMIGMSLLLGSHVSVAQKIPNTNPDTVQVERIGKIVVGSTKPSAVEPLTIRGIIKDANDASPLQGAHILLKGTTQEMYADADGRFAFKIEHPQPMDVLEFSFVGYEPVEYPLKVCTESSEITVAMDLNVTMLGGAEVYFKNRWTPRTIWLKIKRLFQ